MPSLRKRVSSYFRQLSFHNEPREKRHNINENSFITKYLQGDIKLHDGPPIVHGKNPMELPNYDLCSYRTGPESIVGCYTGPSGGCTTIQRQEKHLSMGESEIEFIDNPDEENDIADNDTLIHMTSPTTDSNDTQASSSGATSSTKLPPHWRKSSEYAFGVAHSLYDKNPITGKQNGDPIADCFGLISRRDSAVLAVADGVNWGEKACIAAKSAIHASLHYLNTTLFHDSTLFTPNHHPNIPSPILSTSPMTSTIHQTKDVFIALLRAFHCAHDLILERGGMLTTLTVAVVLPVKGRSVVSGAASDGDDSDDGDDAAADVRRKISQNVRVGSLGENLRQAEIEGRQQRYVCCVCNVGDTLAYVYSQRDGIRELTKGSHDINCNRDMRDALGALGPVDGHNPELSNLTLSITTVQRGDIILVASDGLTDNFDPNVCKFTVSANSSSVATNTSSNSIKKKPDSVVNSAQTAEVKQAAVVLQVPVKPPRKAKNYIAMNRESVSSRSSVASVASSSQRSGSKTSLSMPEEVSANPLIAQFIAQQQDAVKAKAALPVQKSISMKNVPTNQGKSVRKDTGNTGGKTTQHPSSSMVAGFSFLRSKTLVDFRPQTASVAKSQIARNNDGVPFVTPLQRYELTLLLMEDILKRGITGRETQCVTARKLCQELYNFTISLTNAKRKTLEEDSDLYYNQQHQQQTNAASSQGNSGGGVLVELGAMERKVRRKRALERVQALPGKLDHVTVVACNVGMW